ncbi:hypothetical protein bthur0001_26300 [Bacillus thuringiensis serovar tochigiensis BGSC 4Y1]|nr:hypothetical protein bthur0001_26300 [Bacillus thuringiensis serovar tochigiensis BGSC 4Y1]
MQNLAFCSNFAYSPNLVNPSTIELAYVKDLAALSTLNSFL